MLWTNAVHRGAETAMVIEADNALALICVPAREAIDEVNLGADREGGPRGRLFDQRDDPLGRAERVSLLADLPAAFRVHDDLNAGIFRAHIFYVAGQESLVN